MSDLTILALGDSLTAGFMVAAKKAYPALLEQKLIAAGYACRVINAGINGETSSGALSRISQALSLKPDIVILETGINDHLSGFDPALTARNIRQMVRICKESGVTVILAGMLPIWAFGGGDPAAFAQLYPTIAEEEAVILIPSFLEGVVDQPGGNFVLTQADGVHPTAAGYKVVAETVYPYVLEAINRLL
jgi:acyl-CoA thioesterase-1